MMDHQNRRVSLPLHSQEAEMEILESRRSIPQEAKSMSSMDREGSGL